MTDQSNAASALSAMKAQKAELEANIAKATATARAELKADLEAQAKTAGFTLADIFGSKGPSKRQSKGKPWVNPNDASQVWGGIGKRPGWLTELLAAGYTQEQFQQ